MSKENTPGEVTLIKPRAVLELLPFVSYAGLYAGSYGTNVLTRYPVGRMTLYSREEVIAMKDKIIGKGRTNRARDEWEDRIIPQKLV